MRVTAPADIAGGRAERDLFVVSEAVQDGRLSVTLALHESILGPLRPAVRSFPVVVHRSTDRDFSCRFVANPDDGCCPELPLRSPDAGDVLVRGAVARLLKDISGNGCVFCLLLVAEAAAAVAIVYEDRCGSSPHTVRVLRGHLYLLFRRSSTIC